MQHYFELYILTDDLTPENWTKFYQALGQLGGLLSKFELVFTCQDNVVRYFVSSDKDLSGLSNNIDGVILRPVDASELKSPPANSKERLVQFVTGGNLLDLKEKYGAQKSKDLQYASFKVSGLGSKALIKSSLYFKNKAGQYSKASKLMHLFPAKLFAIDFANNTRYLKKSVPKYLNIEKSLHMLGSDKTDALFEIDTFPYFSHSYYLNLTNYEFDKHSFIVGASGSGKSKLISLMVDRLSRTALKMNYRVIVIDPHDSIAPDFAHIADSQMVNFNKQSTELFAGAESDITAATELTATLFKSLLADQFNPKVDRTLRFSLFVLFTAQNMTLDNLKRFLTDLEYRNQVMGHVSGYVPENIIKFFGADFNELRNKYYNEAILPVVSLVDEMQMQPMLVGEGELSLQKTIADNFLTVFSLNKVSMGEKVVKTVAGLLIQQIFLLAQARAFSQKVILIIDEVSVIQNPALASILAEARKFNLSVILTQQYFGQVEKDLRDAIFANVYNYYAFKVSEEDARALEGNLNIELPKELVDEETAKGLKESEIRVKIMTELHPRECLVRVVASGQVVPAVKARTVDAPNSVPTSPGSAKLSSYKQTKTALPTKFQEGEQAVPKMDISTPVQSSPTAPNTEPVSATSPSALGRSAIAKTKTEEARATTKRFNLSELLAEHSSSRLKVNQRKEKQ